MADVDVEKGVAEATAGNSKFGWNKRVVLGPDYWRWLVVVFGLTSSILGSSLIAGWWLVENHLGVGIFFLVTTCLLSACTLVFVSLAAMTDPGILPRGTTSPEDVPESDNAVRLVEVNGVPTIMKFCGTCQIWRPPRSHHCRKCDNCIEKFDHHCPYVGNCVGARNYHYLLKFIMSYLASMAFGFPMVILAITWESISLQSSQNLSPAEAFGTALKTDGTFLLFIYLFINVWFSFFCVRLLVIHLRLIWKNTTVAERNKKTFEHGNPYPKRGWQNFRAVCFPDVKPSRIVAGYEGPTWSLPEDCDVTIVGEAIDNLEQGQSTAKLSSSLKSTYSADSAVSDV
ncbi:hypothetical protein NDN08_007395 [Rhodosorus marinus]|uniref:Palmitoyltransferase n=1 Tax=Rhodosorus marinus TaxID=101924 RepID=A0AAV8UXF3_9RHOD|nr:hypothetical protein NDN08_007395 [Rhodosorus marinus]